LWRLVPVRWSLSHSPAPADAGRPLSASVGLTNEHLVAFVPGLHWILVAVTAVPATSAVALKGEAGTRRP